MVGQCATRKTDKLLYMTLCGHTEWSQNNEITMTIYTGMRRGLVIIEFIHRNEMNEQQ